MSFLANLIKWKVPRTSTDASGNTVLVGADRTFPLTQSQLEQTVGSAQYRQYSGTASSATATTLVDAAAAFSVNEFAGNRRAVVMITAGTGAGQLRSISANDATSVTVATWTVTPDNTSEYRILVTDGALNSSYTPHQLMDFDSTGGYTIAAGTTIVAAGLADNYGFTNAVRMEAPGTNVGDAANLYRDFPMVSAGVYAGPTVAPFDSIHAIFKVEQSAGAAENWFQIRASHNNNTTIFSYNLNANNDEERFYSVLIPANAYSQSGTAAAWPQALSDFSINAQNRNAGNATPPHIVAYAVKKNVRTPPKIVLVFDDGFVSTWSLAAKELARYGIKATAAIAREYSNPFDATVGTNQTISSSATGATTTFTTGSAHGLRVGQQVYLGGFSATNWRLLNDTVQTVTATPTGTTFTIAVDSSSGYTGTSTGKWTRYMPETLLRRLYHDYGWDFATHGVAGFNTMTAAEIATHIQTEQAYLLGMGFDRAYKHHMYVGGYQKDSGGTYARSVLEANGVLSARHISSAETMSLAPYPYGLAQKYHIRSTNIDSHTSDAQLARVVKETEYTMKSGGIRVFHMHDVFASGTPSADNNMSLALLQSIADFLGPLHLSGQIECVTWSEMWMHHNQCKVMTPPSGW